MSNLPRGLKNCNPGNIVKDSRVWLGEVIPSRDVRFKQFKDMAHGYRAIFVNLSSYISRGHNTIEKIIKRWAPPSENNTASYIVHVAQRTGIGKDRVISLTDYVALKEITKAISRIENGVSAVDRDVEAGFALWLGRVQKKKP
ncbi:MAG: structural protein P5 [Porphyromonadaceae bacterium]|nr:structural protein P5 [Porphyromonadaceae bacterium]